MKRDNPFLFGRLVDVTKIWGIFDCGLIGDHFIAR
jgi:hypothetical protein